MARTRPPHRKSARRRRDAGGYHVNIPRSLAALVTGTPELGDSARRLLAESVLYVLRNDPGSGPWGRQATSDPDEFVNTLRTLHDKGWLSVWDGCAYPSEPVIGPLGTVIDRIRMSETDLRFAVQMFADNIPASDEVKGVD